MNELLTRAIEADEVGWLAEFPRELLNEAEVEMADYVIDYSMKHGQTPSLKQVMKEHEGFLPYKFTPTAFEMSPPPIGQVFEDTVHRKLMAVTDKKLREAKAHLEREKEVPLEILVDIERIAVMATGVHKFSTFDRHRYFREGILDLPFRVINRHIGGLSDGDFMLVAGRLGTGKSTIVQAITKHFWEQGLKILFVSAEMLPADVFARIDAMIGAFNPLDLRKPKTTTMEGLLDAVHSVVSEEDGEIVVPKSRMMTPASIGTFARNLGADLIIVDGAYLLRPSSGHFSSKWERVATVSNELKQLALDLEVPMIGTVQIKRGAGGKDTYDPEDIALSDALGQDADFVLAINPSSVVEGSSELQLIKNRFGSTCTTRISTDFSTMKITETSLPKVGADEEDWKSWVKS